MITGKSLFESLLDRLDEEKPEDEEPDVLSARIRGLSTGFVAPAMEGVSVSLHRIDGAYLENIGEDIAPAPPEDEAPPAPAEEPALPEPAPYLLRQLPAEIAEDLQLSPSDTIAALHEKRRSFALANHPDRVHETHRALATVRMTLANLLIDKAIARIAAMERLGLR